MYRTPGILHDEAVRIRERLIKNSTEKIDALHKVLADLSVDCVEQRVNVHADLHFYYNQLESLSDNTPDPHYIVEYADNREIAA
jgi:hypothetical protein